MLNEALQDILFGSFDDVFENRQGNVLDLSFAFRQLRDIIDPDLLNLAQNQPDQFESSNDEEEELSDGEQKKKEAQRQNLTINEPNYEAIKIPEGINPNQYLKTHPQYRTFLRQIDLRNSLLSGYSSNTRSAQNGKYPIYAFSDLYYASTEDVRLIYDRVINDILYKHKKVKTFDEDYYDQILQNFSVLTDQQIKEHIQQSKDSELLLDSFKKFGQDGSLSKQNKQSKNIRQLQKYLTLYTQLQNESKDGYTILCQEQIFENPYGKLQQAENQLNTANFYRELYELVNKKHKKVKIEKEIDYQEYLTQLNKEIQIVQTENIKQEIENELDQQPFEEVNQNNQIELECNIRKNDEDHLIRFFNKRYNLFENQSFDQMENEPQQKSKLINKSSFLYQSIAEDNQIFKCESRQEEAGYGLLQRIQQQLEDEKKLTDQPIQNQPTDDTFKQCYIDKKDLEFQKALDSYSYYNKDIMDFCLGKQNNFLTQPFEAYNRIEIDLANSKFFSEKLEVLLHQKKFPEKIGQIGQFSNLNRLAAPSIVSRQIDNRSALSHAVIQSADEQEEESQDMEQFGEMQDLNQQFGNEDYQNKELLNLIETKIKAYVNSEPQYNQSLVAESFLLNEFSQDLQKHSKYHRNNVLDNLYVEKKELLGLEREQVKYFDIWNVELVGLTRENKKDNREIMLEELTEKQNSQEYYKQLDSLSLSKGNFILMEYIEQRPVILNNTGMCSRVTRYVYHHRALSQFSQKKKQQDADDALNSVMYQFTDQTKQITADELTLFEFKNMLVEQLGKIGQIRFLDKSQSIPLQGQLTDDKIIGVTIIENELYRAPVFKQKLPITDFLLVRTRDVNFHYKYTLRPIDCIYLVGQIEPKQEIYTPHSRPLGTFLKNCLKTYIKKMFRTDQEVKQEELEIIFQKQSSTNIRTAIRECKGVQDSPNQKIWRYQKGGDDHSILKYDITPVQVCQYESMLHSSYLLQEFGLRDLKNSDKMKKTLQEFLTRHPNDFEDWVIAKRIEDELNMTAWSLSQSFLHSANQTGRMLLYGIGDPTSGHGGLSYIKKPLKARGEKGQNAVQDKKPQVMGTDDDLRKLHVSDIQQISRKLGLQNDQNLKRWKMINKLTQFLLQSQNPDDQETREAIVFKKNLELLSDKEKKQLTVIQKYARNQRLTTKKQKEQYQKELDKQLAILISNLNIKVMGNYFEDFKEVKERRVRRKLDKDDKNKDLEYNAQDLEPFLIKDQENYKLRIEAFQMKEKKIWLEKKKKKGLL